MPTKKFSSERQLNTFSSAPLRTLSSIPFVGMSLFRPSVSTTVLEDRYTSEEENRWFRHGSARSPRRKKKRSLHRTLSSPSSGSHRSFRFSECPSRSLTCPSRPSFSSYRSLRNTDSPTMVGVFSPRRSRYKTNRVNEENISDSYDFIDKTPTECGSIQSRLCSVSNFNQCDNANSENIFNFVLSTEDNRRYSTSRQIGSSVGRSVSSPAGLQPSNISRIHFPRPPHSPTSPGMFRYSDVNSNNNIDNDSNNYAIESTVVSPTLSLSGELLSFPITRTLSRGNNEEMVTPRILNSFSSLESSRNSLRVDSEDQNMQSDMVNTFGRPRTVAHSLETSNFWQDINPGNLNALEEEQEERPRLSQLALSHLTARDIRSLNHFYSPPPSYEKLCNPESLPTYQEAISGVQINLKRLQDRTIVFTLPSIQDISLSSPRADRLFLQSSDNSQRHIGGYSSLDISDSEGDYNTILDAIPQHSIPEPWPEVPISFTPSCSWSKFRYLRRHMLCSKTICNKELVKKELNSRWPFIIRAKEDDRCPGLLFVECSSSLTVAQLSENNLSGTEWNESVEMGENARLMDNQTQSITRTGSEQLTDQSEPLTRTLADELTMVDVDSSDNNRLMFYLCGKCVDYDSFDCESVKTHIELDCTGQLNKWAHISELYLLLRAILFVLAIIFVIMILPLG